MITPSLCIVLHDVAPETWPRCRKILDVLGTIDDFSVTLLAVPHYHGGARDSEFERWLQHRAERGDEIALHGYNHLDSAPTRNWIDWLRRRVYTRGEGEFADLPLKEASTRLQSGVEWLSELGIPPAGFVAPAWLLGTDAWRALRQQTFEYTCTLRRIYLLPDAESLRCQSQVYSSSTAWRRAMSVPWNETLAWLQRRHPVVRLELHPGDLHPAVRRSWVWLAHQQTLKRRVCTLRDISRELRTTEGSTEPSRLR